MWQKLAVLVLALSTVVLTAGSAHAYPWMIRHDYTGCGMCHLDPSGGGVLTEYGRAQGILLLRTNYAGGEQDEPGKSAGFLWGAVTPPEWLLPGGSLRTLSMEMKTDGASYQPQFIIMQADLRAGVQAGGFRAYGSFGGVTSGGSRAAVAGNAVSREHWLGYAFGSDQQFLLRAGRINVPYGIRSIDHTLYVRQATRVDLNDTQQHGVAFAYSGDLVRGEVMAIAGNYQIRPDAFRERGYSGFVEIAPWSRIAFGASSLWTHAAEDIDFRTANTRQADGLFARIAPWRPLVLMLEGDLVMNAPAGVPRTTGIATMVKADIEPLQGVHVITTGETFNDGSSGAPTSYGGWFGVGWFFASHIDVRGDVMYRKMAVGPTTIGVTAFMGQLHVYL